MTTPLSLLWCAWCSIATYPSQYSLEEDSVVSDEVGEGLPGATTGQQLDLAQLNFLTRTKRAVRVLQHSRDGQVPAASKAADQQLDAGEQLRVAQDKFVMACLRLNIRPQPLLHKADVQRHMNFRHFYLGDELGRALGERCAISVTISRQHV